MGKLQTPNFKEAPNSKPKLQESCFKPLRGELFQVWIFGAPEWP